MTVHPWQCRHCGASAGSRPRNLCWRCYDDPAIRALYPLVRYARQCLPAEPVVVTRPEPIIAAVVDTKPQRPLLFSPAEFDALTQ